MAYVSQSEYARMRGVSQRAVAKMIATGRIPAFDSRGRKVSIKSKVRKFVDPVRADAALNETQRRFDYTARVKAPAASDKSGDAVGPAGSVVRIRAASMAQELQERRFKFDILRGKYTPKEASLMAAEEAGRTIRRSLDSIEGFSDELTSAAIAGGVQAVRKFIKGRVRELEEVLVRALNQVADVVAERGDDAAEEAAS